MSEFTKAFEGTLAFIKIARPLHWVKNLAIFAALIFSGYLFQRQLFMTVFWAFWAFNFTASAGYIINDIKDASRDRLHPIKKNRPIAKGTLPVSIAILEAAVLAGLAVLIGLVVSVATNSPFVLVIIAYFVIQLCYSLFLKNLSIIDILIIASGFVIRVYAGAIVIDAHLSVWFLLCVISAALFLAAGKRRAELSVVDVPGKTRASLSKYPKDLLNSYVTMFGNAAWMSWALFAFFEKPAQDILSTPIWLTLAEVSKATTISKFLMATIPVTIFGIMRYESLIFQGRTEAPEKILLTDKALVASVVIWTLMVIGILYTGL